jgi:hypothetical protein
VVPAGGLWLDCPASAEAGWTELMTGAYKGTFVFGYIVCVMFMLFFLALLIFSDPITKELGICEHY